MLLSWTADQFRIAFLRQKAQRAADAAALAVVSNQKSQVYAQELKSRTICSRYRRERCTRYTTYYWTDNPCTVVYIDESSKNDNAIATLYKNWPWQDKASPENIEIQLVKQKRWYLYPYPYGYSTIPPYQQTISGYWGAKVSFDVRVTPKGWKVVNPNLGDIVISSKNRISATAEIVPPQNTCP